MDLLRRKLSLQEDSVRMKNMLQSEKDEANLRYVYLRKGICIYIFFFIALTAGSRCFGSSKRINALFSMSLRFVGIFSDSLLKKYYNSIV